MVGLIEIRRLKPSIASLLECVCSCIKQNTANEIPSRINLSRDLFIFRQFEVELLDVPAVER